MAKFRIKSVGSMSVPQRRVVWWWKDIAPPQLTEPEAQRLIHLRKHRAEKAQGQPRAR
jgi:hypothetical protein